MLEKERAKAFCLHLDGFVGQFGLTVAEARIENCASHFGRHLGGFGSLLLWGKAVVLREDARGVFVGGNDEIRSDGACVLHQDPMLVFDQNGAIKSVGLWPPAPSASSYI